MSARSWHHYYHGQGIDMAKTHDSANESMRDNRDPRSSIVHDHPHGAPCDGKDHTAYDHTTLNTIPFVALPEILHAMADVRAALEQSPVANLAPMGNGLRTKKD